MVNIDRSPERPIQVSYRIRTDPGQLGLLRREPSSYRDAKKRHLPGVRIFHLRRDLYENTIGNPVSFAINGEVAASGEDIVGADNFCTYDEHQDSASTGQMSSLIGLYM